MISDNVDTISVINEEMFVKMMSNNIDMLDMTIVSNMLIKFISITCSQFCNEIIWVTLFIQMTVVNFGLFIV